MANSEPSLPTLVGIGASAGGLEALKVLLPELPTDSGFAFVIIVHLRADHPSLLAEVLQPFSPLPVTQVVKDLEVQPNHVYVISPGFDLSANDDHLRLSKITERRVERGAIDHFLETLAKTHGERCIGVILSGTGSDGSVGLEKIKEHGGLTLAQDPGEAQFNSMPQNAIATGLVDFVLPVKDMPGHMLRFATTQPRIEIGEPSEQSSHDRQLLDQILAEVRAGTKMDFAKYKQSTVLRRIRRRMQLNQHELLKDYLDFLRASPTEAQLLADEFLITVTRFFRDAEVFDNLEKEIVPRLFEGKTAADTIRVWSVGCATGEEAYSVAMLLLEQASRTVDAPKIEVFASDLHEPSLRRAREGDYPDLMEPDVSPERLRRFFAKQEDSYRVRKELRAVVVFSNHNLLRDPPFSHLDLIICRNLLIYLQRDLQNDVIELFHYALNPGGLLLLGPSESVDRTALFLPENKQLCLYRRRNVPAPEPRLPVFPQTFHRVTALGGPSPRVDPSMSYGVLHQKMVERYAPPSLLVDQDFRVVHASEHAGRYLQFPGGEPSVSVFRVAREELQVELGAALHSAVERGESSRSRPILIELDGKPKQVVFHVWPSKDAALGSLQLVIFDEYDVSEATPAIPLAPDTTETRKELEGTRERLRSIVEQYETSQEEMRAANEELQSVNEELRSTLEELETSKEELQSMNEELQTVNEENRHKVEELSQLTSDLQNLMAATDIATLFLDRELRIMRVTPRARDLFNILPSDRGRPITDLRRCLGYSELEQDALLVLERLVPVEREVQSETGEWYLSRVNPYRSSSDHIQGVVITLVEITQFKSAELAVRNSEENFRALVEASAQIVWTTDEKGVLRNSPSWRAFTGQTSEQFQERGWVNAVYPDERGAVNENSSRQFQNHKAFDAEIRLRRNDGEWRWMHMHGVPLRSDAGEVRGWVGMSTDITDRKLREIEQRDARSALENSNRRKDEFLALLGHELRNPLAALTNVMTLMKQGGSADQQAARLEMSQTQAKHLGRLVDDLLDVARVNSGRLELRTKVLDLRDVVRAAADVAQYASQARHITLDVEQSSEPLQINGDDDRLAQIVSNVLDNSIKYTGEGGKIRISTRAVDSCAEISVADNGRGLARETLVTIFDAFARVEPPLDVKIGGLGLGLSLVRRLVELHGGSVEARSEGLGRGAEFIVRLPLAATQALQSAGESIAAKSDVSSGASRCVLVVDDNTTIAESTAMLLEMDGHQVFKAYNGTSALELAAAHAPEVVVLDIGLPDMDGFELARRLRAQKATATSLLIAATGFGQSDYLVRAKESEIDHHLVKPVDFKKLTELVSKGRAI